MLVFLRVDLGSLPVNYSRLRVGIHKINAFGCVHVGSHPSCVGGIPIHVWVGDCHVGYFRVIQLGPSVRPSVANPSFALFIWHLAPGRHTTFGPMLVLLHSIAAASAALRARRRGIQI